jgi:hypothetical protein
MFATSYSRENLLVDKNQKSVGDPRLTPPETENGNAAGDESDWNDSLVVARH